MKRALGMGILLLCGLFLGATPNSAAQDSGSVTGVVSDQTGAVLVNAEVTLENTNTKTVFHAKTNSVGSYTIPNVPAGPAYRMTFSHAGFAALEYSDIYLSVASTRTQNAKLNPTAASTTIDVSAAGQETTLNTADASVGNSFDVRQLDQLPVQVRDTPAVLFTLQPGVATFSLAGTTAAS